MKAIVHRRYGSPDRLEQAEIDAPSIGANGVLVRMRAAAVNPYDVHLLRGRPYILRLSEGFRRPKRIVPGVDVAGIVEAVGESVTLVRPGDEVFGGCAGAFAELVRLREPFLIPKPATLSFDAAAAVPTAGCTALQGLRDQAATQPGQRVLINGAAGGVGTFAVQIAKAFGADVTAVCSTRNIDLVRSLGADDVIDHTRDDFTRTARPYDVIFDAVGNRSLRACRRVLDPRGTLVLVGGSGGRMLGPLPRALAASLRSRIGEQRLRFFLAKVTAADLRALTDLITAGTVTPIIDRTRPLGDAAEAIAYVATGHARGKVILTNAT